MKKISQEQREQESTTEQHQRRPRFQVVKLEERLAPTTSLGGLVDDGSGEDCTSKGHYNPHGKWVGGGRIRGSF